MAEFVKLTTFRGEDLFVNVELVQAIGKGTDVDIDGPHSLVHFGPGHGFLVQGAPEDVMDIIWPAAKQVR